MGKVKEFLNDKGNRDTLKFGLIGFTTILGLYLFSRFVIGDFIGNWILETTKVWVFLVWVTYTYFMSKFEAYYYTHEVHSTFKEYYNEHALLNITRLLLWLPIVFIIGFLPALGLGLIFPFWHDGCYYTFREKIKKGTYPKKFFDQSDTSTAKSTRFMTPVVRTIVAIVGIVLYIIL